MKKILSLICLAALLLSSCGSAPDETETAAAAVETIAEVPETTLADQIRAEYGGTAYDGYEFRILAIQPGGHFYSKISPEANEIWYAEQTGDIYNDAVYTRNLLTEELLDIRLSTLWGKDYTDVGTQIQKFVQAGDDTADLALTALATNITQATSGYLHNLYTVESITLDAEWYDRDIVRNYSYKGNKLYCVTGAYNVFDDYAVPVIFYARDIMNLNGLEDPSALVPEGKWTLDAMMTMAETVTTDANGDGVMDKEDAWGYLDNSDFYPHLLEGAGQPRTLVGSDGIPVLNVTSEAYIDVGEKIYNLVVDSEARFIGSNADCVAIMKENRGLFYYELLGAINEFRDMESDFSLLPMPKYDEALEHYTSPINPIWCTTVSVPVTVSDTERAGTVLNVLSAFSVDTVNSALYELLLGSKLIRDTATLDMLDHVLTSKVYDWANGFSWSSSIQNALNSQANANSFTLASKMQSAAPAAEKALQDFLGKLDTLP